MFLLKSLGQFVWGENKNELVKLEGKLEEGEGNSAFSICSALIHRTSQPFASSLLVSRLGSSSQDDEEHASISELSFFIAPEMELTHQGNNFAWKDPEGKKWTFIPSDTTSPALIQLFELTLLQCIYEWDHKTPPTEATEEELLSYYFAENTQERNPASPSSSPFASASSSSPTPASSSAPSTPLKQPANKSNPLFSIEGSLDGTKEIFNCKSNLFWFDPIQGVYELIAENIDVTLFQKAEMLDFLFCVQDRSNKKVFTLQPLNSDMNPVFYHAKPLTLTYGTEEKGIVQSWGVKVKDTTEERSLVNMFGRCITESLRQESFQKLKEDERQSILSGYLSDDEEMEDADKIESSDEEMEDADTFSYKRGQEKEKNSQLNVGFNYDRSFVVRGNKIGVFKNQPDSLEFSTTINDIQTPDGKSFSPRKTMLHMQDSSMILMSPSSDHSIFKLDLNYGKVVEEWKIDDHTTVKGICPESKFAQKTPNQTFVGMSHNAIYLVDPRLSGNKQVKEMTKQYAREARNDFSSTATTEKGELVVVSNKGDLRLFSHINKNAKTHLPGFGDPIIGVDVTADGKWVLATCKTYLIIINSEIKDSGVTGFAKSMGQNKPIPKRLQLRPEHVASMGCQPSFTPAHFNVGEDEETTIVTSSGPYVVTWNFRRVKAGHLYDYRIKKYPDTVVADNFRFGQHKSIVVALPDDVTMIQKSHLVRPKGVE